VRQSNDASEAAAVLSEQEEEKNADVASQGLDETKKVKQAKTEIVYGTRLIRE
jgi:hydrocephalus-inducing protein